jgi:serine phosphatase RsbU (regulator of sigma subunit)
LIAVLEGQRECGAEALVRTVVDAILQFSGGEQQDDITLLVARALQGNA